MGKQDNTPIHIRMNKKEMQEAFIKGIKSGRNADLFCEALMEMFNTDFQYEILFKALSGIKPKNMFEVGELLWCEVWQLSTYDWDKKKMVDEGLIVDNKIKVRLSSFNPWKQAPYNVSYKYIKTENSEDGGITKRLSELGNVELQALQRVEEFPEFGENDPLEL